jgi:hypothetical protein
MWKAFIGLIQIATGEPVDLYTWPQEFPSYEACMDFAKETKAEIEAHQPPQETGIDLVPHCLPVDALES